MKRNSRKEFPQPDGTIAVCETDANGKRLPTRYISADGIEAPPQPRAVESFESKPERTTPKRETRYDCIHIEGSTGATTKHLCGGCPGGQVATIFTCELFGECLPAAWAPTPESTARRCLDCKKYVAETGD